MSERRAFLDAYEHGGYSVTELCERFGISRKTGYKWLARAQSDAPEGLAERSRAPKSHPNQTPDQITRILVSAREKHPHWGPVKLRHWLLARQPELEERLPAPSTIGAILKRHGLVKPHPRRRRWPHTTGRIVQAPTANAVWAADFKGQFRTQDGKECFPLTITDAYSRFLLSCQALESVAGQGVRPVFEQVFQTYGLPEAIRTDNGSPFASRAIAGLSSLNVWWHKLGIEHQRIAPGRPEQNGRHERMHRTLKQETTRPPQATLAAQQLRFDAFRQEYNDERPHAALLGRVPTSVYTASLRPYPACLAKPEYSGHLEVRQVSNSGMFRFHARQIFLSEALAKETIGLEEIDDGVWSVYFYDLLLARLDERDYVVRPGLP
jgi:transposase InsO family protein